MATINVTNRTASQTLRGQDAIVTLDSTDTGDNLPSIEVGQLCTIDSSSNTGTVSFVDYFGNTFRITPIQPDKDLSSTSTPGILAVDETITITV